MAIQTNDFTQKKRYSAWEGYLIMIIYAVNISNGGGKVLLDEILTHHSTPPISCIFLDTRYSPPVSVGTSNTSIYYIKPKILDRWKAEFTLRRESLKHPDSKVLAFGNLPPLLRLNNKTIVYLQNAFLLPKAPFPKDGLKPLLRNIYERLIWLVFQKNIDEVWVQTPWMKDAIASKFPTKLMPIIPTLPSIPSKIELNKTIKFLCVTGIESHKNLSLLLQELLTLNQADLNFTLITKIPKSKKWTLGLINQCKYRWKNFVHINDIGRDELYNAYLSSQVLINTSEMESFCLPIYEALHFGLKVRCLNRKFTMHLLERVESFENVKDLVSSIER